MNKTRQQLLDEFHTLRNDDYTFQSTYGELDFDEWVSDNDIVPESTYFEVRVMQLESEGISTSDSEAIADMETMHGTLRDNINMWQIAKLNKSIKAVNDILTNGRMIVTSSK